MRPPSAEANDATGAPGSICVDTAVGMKRGHQAAAIAVAGYRAGCRAAPGLFVPASAQTSSTLAPGANNELATEMCASGRTSACHTTRI